MSCDSLWQCYGVLPAFFESKRITRVSPEIEYDEFKQKLCSFQHIAVMCEYRGKITAIVLLSENSDAHRIKKNFERLHISLDSPQVMMMFSMELVSNSVKHALKRVKIYSYHLRIIAMDIRKAKLVPKHEICSAEEIKELEKFYVSIDEMPIILQSDPLAIWIDAVPGDVVKIHRVSESTGESLYYRRVA